MYILFSHFGTRTHASDTFQAFKPKWKKKNWLKVPHASTLPLGRHTYWKVHAHTHTHTPFPLSLPTSCSIVHLVRLLWASTAFQWPTAFEISLLDTVITLCMTLCVCVLFIYFTLIPPLTVGALILTQEREKLRFYALPCSCNLWHTHTHTVNGRQQSEWGKRCSNEIKCIISSVACGPDPWVMCSHVLRLVAHCLSGAGLVAHGVFITAFFNECFHSTVSEITLIKIWISAAFKLKYVLNLGLDTQYYEHVFDHLCSHWIFTRWRFP